MMDPWQWMEILRENPARAAECPCWDEFTPMEWMLILEVHPQFAEKCPWNEFDGYCWSTLGIGAWEKELGHFSFAPAGRAL